MLSSVFSTREPVQRTTSVPEGDQLAISVDESGDHDYTTGYETCKGRLIRVSVHRLSSGIPTTASCRMIELSQSGAKLASDTMIPVGETVSLQIKIPHLDVHFTTSAVVSWVGFQGEYNWFLGCGFANQLSQKCVDRLANANYIERRESRRERIMMDARVEVNEEDYSQQVRLLDYSSGGFCMKIDRSCVPGDRVLLEMTNANGTEMFIPAEARWCNEEGSEYAVGCQFLGNNGFDVFQDALSGRPTNIEVERWWIARLSYWGWIGFGAAIGLGLLSLIK